MALSILIAEDEDITLKHLVGALQKEGHHVTGVTNGNDALSEIQSHHPDLLIADIKMPGPSGIELLDLIREQNIETEVIIITGFGSVASAVTAMKKGAYDYVTKPFDLDELVLKVEKIQRHRALLGENTALKTFLGFDGNITIIAQSDSMRNILETIEGLKDSECNLLITGETGVGKSLIARIVHTTSQRQAMPFLTINCATLTEEMLASELFGHEKGAFTGAIQTKQGLVEITDKGTLFLDEIAEMPTNLQAKLLRIIEDGEFYRVGGTRPMKVDVRFIAATNKNVPRIIADGKFREDLYYRLNVMELFIAPLRDRPEDIRPLAESMLQKHLPGSNKDISGFTEGAMNVLENYTYPGNVRELENIIERAIILEKSNQITVESLPQAIQMFQIETIEPKKIKTLEELNKEYAEKVVRIYENNRTKAARTLGISRTRLWRLLKEE